MRQLGMLILAGSTILCAGCTTLLLKEYTLRQTKTSGEGRDTLVLRCLATVAANPNALPPFAVYSVGIATVTDSATINVTSTWAPFKRTLDNLGVTATTSPKGQWTVDPTVEYQQLEAMQAACLWALFGPEYAAQVYPTGILGDPQRYLDGKAHFGVEKRLAALRPGWVQRGRLQDVPSCARYKEHKGKTWIWVMPQDSESFAQFTLALQDIATLDPTIIAPPPLLVHLTTNVQTSLLDPTGEAGKPKKLVIGTTETRAVKPEYREMIEKAIQAGISVEDDKEGKVNLTRAQWMDYTEPWPGVRGPAGSTPTTPSPAATSLPVPSEPNLLVVPPALRVPSFTPFRQAPLLP
jgi:hypothetical protein